MRLTTKGRYAVTAMLDLSLNYEVGTITLADISARQGISLSYLEQLFSRLRKQNLVSSTRGPGGGYTLSRSPDKITILDVILAVDEKMDNTACEGKANCHDGEQCLSHHLWESLSDQIRVYLSGITLEQVVQSYDASKADDKIISFNVQ